jgi:hypothetical protein
MHELGVFKQILRGFCSIIGFLNSLCGKEMFLGIVIGISEKEAGIRVGSKVVTYGTLLYDKVTGNLRIEGPEYLAGSREDILDYLKRSEYGMATFGAIFGVLAGVSAIFVVKGIRQTRRRREN